jgi:hypothetical protein
VWYAFGTLGYEHDAVSDGSEIFTEKCGFPVDDQISPLAWLGRVEFG